METFATVYRVNVGSVPPSNLGGLARDPSSLQFRGSCGNSAHHPFTEVVPNFAMLEAFEQSGGGVILTAARGGYRFALLRPGRVGPFYSSNGLSYDARVFPSVESMHIALHLTKAWWFSEPNVPVAPVVKSKLAEKLPLNPHFPVDEVELLPESIDTEAGTSYSFSSASTTIEQITCAAHLTANLGVYASNVPPALRSLKRVIVEAPTRTVTASAMAKDLKPIFSGKTSTTHTLILKKASSATVCAIVKAKMPGLARLVLEECTVDFDEVLPHLASNNCLQELSFDSANVNGGTFDLVRRCGHVAFLEEPSSLSLPPQAGKKSVANPLQDPLKLADFNKLCKQKGNSPIGLLTAYGQVVPLAEDLVPCFELLQDMLDDADGENLVPMELDPPVGKESVALAVHFVTHYVSDEVQKECAKAEAQRSSKKRDKNAATYSWCSEFAHEVHKECEAAEAQQHGDGSSSTNGTNGPSSSFSWCSNFSQFRTDHIEQRYATSERRLQVMCELMALAAYLNCPSLKRFLRAALVMEETDQSSAAGRTGRGKRNRNT